MLKLCAITMVSAGIYIYLHMRGMDQWINAGSDLGSAAKGAAIGLEVAGSGLVSCHFFIPFFSWSCVVL